MRSVRLLLACTAVVSASALAAGEQKDIQQKDTQVQRHDQETVKQVQQKLSQEGIEVGPVDGIMGPKTQAALKEYQQKNQLEATGRLNEETLAELGVEARASASVGGSGGGSMRDAQPELRSRDAETRSIGEKFPASK